MRLIISILLLLYGLVGAISYGPFWIAGVLPFLFALIAMCLKFKDKIQFSTLGVFLIIFTGTIILRGSDSSLFYPSVGKKVNFKTDMCLQEIQFKYEKKNVVYIKGSDGCSVYVEESAKILRSKIVSKNEEFIIKRIGIDGSGGRVFEPIIETEFGIVDVNTNFLVWSATKSSITPADLPNKMLLKISRTLFHAYISG